MPRTEADHTIVRRYERAAAEIRRREKRLSENMARIVALRGIEERALEKLKHRNQYRDICPVCGKAR